MHQFLATVALACCVFSASAQPTVDQQSSPEPSAPALGYSNSTPSLPSAGSGIAELTVGIPGDLLGNQTHYVEWASRGPVERTSDLERDTPPARGTLAITQFDMLDWMILDTWQTNHTWGPDKDYANGGQPSGQPCPTPCEWQQGTALWPGKFYYLKVPSGSVWDINLYDDNYIYGWITENESWNPIDYKKSTFNTNMPMTPRIARAGYPGEQIFIPRDLTSYTRYINCVSTGQNYLDNVIQQVWGPYDDVYLGGNMGTVTVVKLSYFYGCSGTTVDTCGTAEINWYAQQYGWVRWGLYYNAGGGNFVLQHDYRASDVVPGTFPIYFPCF
jgi:hypothetical protein